jgi:hypothetical protein
VGDEEQSPRQARDRLGAIVVRGCLPDLREIGADPNGITRREGYQCQIGECHLAVPALKFPRSDKGYDAGWWKTIAGVFRRLPVLSGRSNGHSVGRKKQAPSRRLDSSALRSIARAWGALSCPMEALLGLIIAWSEIRL